MRVKSSVVVAALLASRLFVSPVSACVIDDSFNLSNFDLSAYQNPGADDLLAAFLRLNITDPANDPAVVNALQELLRARRNALLRTIADEAISLDGPMQPVTELSSLLLFGASLLGLAGFLLYRRSLSRTPHK